MIHFHFGTDWYGAVKRVGPFRVVTEFFHLNSFPLYPRYSAVIGLSGAAEAPWQIVPLAKRDWPSVIVAYLRGVAGGLVVLGSIPLIFGFIFWLLNDGQTDIPPEVIMSAGGIGIATGALLGLPSYLLWRQPNSRERLIRQIANALAYPAADPALIVRTLACEWAADLDLKLSASEISDYRDAIPRSHQYSNTVRQLLLLRVRSEIALANGDHGHEGQTDLLLRDIALSTRNDVPVFPAVATSVSPSLAGVNALRDDLP